VLEGDHVFAAWMAGEEPALGLTQNEFEEIPGPGMGGCPPSPDGQAPTAPTTAQLSSATGSTSVQVAWETPAQPADGSPVTGYRVAAIGGTHAEQEVAERTGATSVSLDGLEAGATYEIKIEAYNGRWSAAQSLGTVVVGSGTGGTTTPPGGGTDPGTDPTALPAAPAGLTATSASLDSAEVSWAATAGATSYTITATSEDTAAAVPAPVTVTAPASTATLTGLTSGTTYTVSVKAANANGEGQAATATVSTLKAVAPAAFDLTRVIPGHESVTAEWTAAAAGNAASPVSGYDLVATPADGQAPVSVAATGTTGTVGGLRNGVEYALTVVAKSGTATTTARVPATVDNTVTPTDVVTVTRAQYRADRREYKVSGTAQDTTANRVHVRTTTGLTIQLNVPVAADGTWTVDVRNGPVLPTNNRIVVTSDSGARVETTITRSR
jgi:hypothetical protein